VYVTRVKPQQCGPLIKDLEQQHGSRSESVSHLKRVRKVSTTAPTDSPPAKKPKTSNTLQVLLGAVNDFGENDWNELLTKYSTTLETCWLPGRPAESKEELEEFNQEWPTVYFHKQTQQHEKEELALTKEEIDKMAEGMLQAIHDAKQVTKLVNGDNATTCISGAVIVCPVSNKLVATANDERIKQRKPGESLPDALNPLCTSILLAIQGVSRRERTAAVGFGMGSETFQKGQYLSTG
jgi:hypothetical protein